MYMHKIITFAMVGALACGQASAIKGSAGYFRGSSEDDRELQTNGATVSNVVVYKKGEPRPSPGSQANASPQQFPYAGGKTGKSGKTGAFAAGKSGKAGKAGQLGATANSNNFATLPFGKSGKAGKMAAGGRFGQGDPGYDINENGLAEAHGCASPEQALDFVSGYGWQDYYGYGAGCSADPANGCAGGCCRVGIYFVCDTYNGFPYLPCVCNDITSDPSTFDTDLASSAALGAISRTFFPPTEEGTEGPTEGDEATAQPTEVDEPEGRTGFDQFP